MGPSWLAWNLDRQIELPSVSNIDDHRIGTAASGEEMCDLFDWLLCGRKADTHRRAMRPCFQSLQRQSQVSAALVVGHCVDFIDDDRFDITQDSPALFRSEQNVKRLWRGD